MRNYPPLYRASDIIAGVIFAVLLSLAVTLLFSGCASVPVELDKTVFYRHDMALTVTPSSGPVSVFDGVGVAPKASSYVLRIESKADVDLLLITSCARDFGVESAIKQGWFKQKRGYEYVYTPDPELEAKGSCLLRLGAYEKNLGRHSWALLDFQTDQEQLPAQISCNGKVWNSPGVSVCQNRAGLYISIKFAVPTEVARNIETRCRPSGSTDDGRSWIFPISERECVIAFQEKGGGHALHRLTTIGYDEIPIRGE